VIDTRNWTVKRSIEAGPGADGLAWAIGNFTESNLRFDATGAGKTPTGQRLVDGKKTRDYKK